MCATFTADDEGKRVVNMADQEVGIVAEVADGTAHVEPSPGFVSKLKSKLGWGSAGENTFELDGDAVEAVTDDEIRIRDQ